ncbi:uncharacterized protein K02A2.6-like [Malaya genurostris]|uniref:uncharacterized protein K02A2.6-like n=1 Tax=Malaya genurostris TaxID=325434 RepID=UPI0026F3C1D5|nr:uncharacterized protein K02A2.6-like [Malaya genurostris]
MANMVTTIEPYRKGTSFSDWEERLGYYFIMNNVTDESKKAHFVTLGGPIIFSELKLLFPNGKLVEAPYNEIVAKLKLRFDKVESDLIQRFKFHQRVQQLDETVEDFILAIKLQAEFCTFGDHKHTAIRDRVVAGLRDKALQQRLLNEDNLTLESAEKIIATWVIAGSNARVLDAANGNMLNRATIVDNPTNSPAINVLHRFANATRLQKNQDPREGSSRGPVKSRLGYMDRKVHFNNYNQNGLNKNFKKFERFRPDFSNMICTFCKKKGHIKSKCFALRNLRKDTVNVVNTFSPGPSADRHLSDLLNRMTTDLRNASDSEEDKGTDVLNCMHVSSISGVNNPCVIKCKIENKLINMEIDCGASVSVMSKLQYESNFMNNLSKCSKQLMVVNGSKLKIVGETNVSIELNGFKSILKLFVIDCNNVFVPLMGRPWLDVFFPKWRDLFSGNYTINRVNDQSTNNLVEEIKQKFSSVFLKDFSSPIKGFEANLVLKNSIPIFKKAYDVPFRLKDKVLKYLEKMEKEKVITPIQTSEWASPVIIVMKKNNEIRMVIDCKVSINKHIIANTYPLPITQDLFANLSGSKIFCLLDLEGAYTQLKLSERSKQFMVINTIKGLYTYNRLPQGASSSASIFQQVMDQVLEGIERVSCYLDDVLISGKDLDDCAQKLNKVLQRLLEANIKVNWDKCKFFVEELKYLGLIINEKGLFPCSDKISTIKNAKEPKNTTELKSFLGLINYYHRFIPHLSEKLYCLYNLLKNNTKYVWDENCNKAFEESKSLLLSTNFLEFYDPEKPIVIISDASGYGLGGVLAHIIEGIEKPVCFTSCSLNSAQKSYPILHLEALALVTTIKKFHKYLFGKKFQIYTDHKPLVGIFGKTGKNSIYVTRLQRYILELSIYDFDIQYRPSHKMGNADFCSRFPLETPVPERYDGDEFIRSINFSKDMPLNFEFIANETKEDRFIQNILKFMSNGWPRKMNRSFTNVYANQHDLESVEGCLMYQDRVVIPLKLQNAILKLLHGNHIGIVKRKQLARRIVYWFGINNDIEKFVGKCFSCNSMAVAKKPKTESNWIPTTKPFSRIHVDFFHFSHHTFLLLVDSYSKWLEINWMKRGTDCSNVLKCLVGYFARFGLPDVLVSDGGPPFNSHAFISFLERQGIKVLKSPPYNPSSNGQAERLVRTTKEVLKKFLLEPEVSELNLEDQINLFLFNYRNNCLTSDGHFPSEKIFSYKPKTLIDLVNPKLGYKRHLLFSQTKDDENIENDRITFRKEQNDPLNELIEGDEIWYKIHNQNNKARWLKATFLKRVSKHIFQITIGNVRAEAYRDQIRVSKDQSELCRPNLLVTASSEKRSRNMEEEDEEFYGFPEIGEAQSRKSSRKRKLEETSMGQSNDFPRRSKRKKTAKAGNDFIYY